MKSKKGFISISTILFIIFVVATLAMLFRIYKNNCFNDFIKAVTDQEAVTKLSRDSKVKYSKSDSYKMGTLEFTFSMFH